MKRRYDNYDYDEAYQYELNKEIEKAAKEQFRKENPLVDDFEEQWKEQQEKLEEWEYEKLLKEGRVNCLYRTSTIKCRNIKSGKEFAEVMIYPSFCNRKDMPRTRKKRETKQAQKNLNDKNARRNLIRLANINFGAGDIWATFGWDDEHIPDSKDRAKKDVTNFIKRVNRKRKKQGLENIKYIYVLAIDNYTRPHFHILMSGDGIDRDELEEMWGKCKRPNTRRVKPDENFGLIGLAEYISRNPHGTKRWHSSKNLERVPEPTRSYSKFKKRKVERMAKNYEVLKQNIEKEYMKYRMLDAEVRYNKITAAFYIYARMVRD